MHERSLPASPNWYCSRCSDVNGAGLLGVGTKNVICLIDISASCRVLGELSGHRGLVSGFSFCRHDGLDHLCVSSANDGAVIFWDSERRAALREVAAHQAAVTALHWSPADRNLVVSGDEKGVLLCHWYHTGDSASFFPEPRSIFCLACSPHAWSCVAVGYKDGMIALVDVSKKGEVTHRLRGHEDEIHSLAWAPRPGEAALHRQENGEASDGGCYLASGGRDQTVHIWSTARGRGVSTLKLPYLKRRGSSAVDPAVKERLWLSVLWPRGRDTQLVTSCFSGELLLWDLTRTGKQKWTLFGSSDGQNHSRIVFNTCSVVLRDGRELLVSTSMDREIKCWDVSSLECRWTLPTLAGFVYALTFSPVGAGCLALGVGDHMIRVWSTLSARNQYDTRTFWQGIKSKVTALAWHPTKEGTLSFGTEDGKVGIYEVFSNKPPQISSSYHRKTIYALSWGPAVPPLASEASEGRRSFSLYSCAGEGVILQHDPARLSGEASDIDGLIRETNRVKHKLAPHTDLSWKPDGKAVAVGNEDGSIEVYAAPDLRLLCSIQQHHKIINALRWHHDRRGLDQDLQDLQDQGPAPRLHGLLASGSSNAIVFVHDLSPLIENPPEIPLVVTEPFRRLCGHTAKITSMAWSPHHAARLVTASYDGTAQVWDVLQEAAICNYRGHAGYLLSVDWSPLDPDLVWTGGKDFTVQEWRISKQEFTKPPKGKKMMDLKEKMKTNPKQKKKNKKVAAAAADTNGEAVPDGEAAPEPSEDEEDDGSPPPGDLRKHLPAGAESLKKPAVFVVKDKPEPTSLRKKKPRSMLPISTCMDHRPREELLQDCLALAAVTHGAPPAGCVPGRGDHVHLGLFSDRRALQQMFQAEEQGHLEAGHFDSLVYLRLWSGDLEGALQLAAARGELDDHLLSMAPMGGFGVWRRTVDAYVKQLCLQEQHLKAASHLLSINKLPDAVELLRTHKLHREAVALAKARLPPDDPVLKDLYLGWASALEKDGHFAAAAKCYVAAGASFDAAKVIARKNDTVSLGAAAALAKIAGESTLAECLALRCAKDLAAAHDWVAAQEVLSSQGTMQVHRLHLCAAELLTSALANDGVPPAQRRSAHAWAEPGAALLDRVRDVWDLHFGVRRESAEDLLREMASAQSPTASASVPFGQVLLQSSLHLTRAALSRLLGDDGGLLTELWRAAALLRDAGHLAAFADFCRALFPDGDVRVYSEERSGTPDVEDAAAASLQAFVLYHRLYQRWWTFQDGGQKTDASSLPLLLSELHASFQADQRNVAEVQERLAAMMLRHRQGGQTDRRQDAGEQEDLLSLSTRMSQHQKNLEELPEAIKTFPRPDVLECCLLLLHLGDDVPESLQNRARDLLRTYGTSPSILRASRRFLT